MPIPSIPHDDFVHASNIDKASRHPSQPVEDSASISDSATEAAIVNATDVEGPMAVATLQQLPSTLSAVNDDASTRQAEVEQAATSDGPGVMPKNVAPPAPEEEANFTAATKDLLDLESPHRPAKTVHLLPQDVQEERKRVRDEAVEEEERKRSEQDKAARPTHLQAQAELASSPSSTIGAYSAATPMPPQESPDTSPDSETAEDVVPPKDLRPSEERQSQEEHDRLLAAQKEIAKKEAMGDDATADDQLQWEARAAVARDTEERAAREEVGGPEPDAEQTAHQTQAEEVMEDVQSEVAARHAASPAPSHGEQPVATLPVTEDGENITVVPRSRPPPIDTTVQGRARESATPARMTTRVSSGAMRRKSVSEITGETPAHAPNRRTPARSSRQPSSPGVSPMNMRHPQENAHVPRGVPTQHTPSRAAQPMSQSGQDETPSLLEDLAPLKGFAEDSGRDYLEPLFRIQAHDSPQNKWTKPLGDLVRMANKSMSTEDQFTTLHERMDYRILRRVYHLQNANKWSLRQMEKVKEPPQPTTHWDHMMTEMKWMRKDFKAERNMKKRVCAYLSSQCSAYVESDENGRMGMMTEPARRQKAEKQTTRTKSSAEEQSPELDASGESAPEDDYSPPTPKEERTMPSTLVVAPELTALVCDLRKSQKLDKALQALPLVGFTERVPEPQQPLLTSVSKFVQGKIMPTTTRSIRKRSRFDYEDDALVLDERPDSKRSREDRALEPEDQDVALFHPDNKPIRDRLHANNAFRPPSENPMPSTSFYEFRNGSQWIWEDDQKLRKLAKEYSFNWQLIADEMTLQSRYKSSAERRTPWECFERWVELETLPAEMRKTLYFKTWFQRLEQSQQAADRRHQAHVAAIQQQAQANGQQAHTPQRRRTIPIRVEKRKNTRYLWLVDAMRKLARKRENNAYKQAEGKRSRIYIHSRPDANSPLATRAAAQRKTQSDTTNQQRGPMLTPQEFSKRRHERDLQMAEAQRQHRQKVLEAQRRQMELARAAQQGAAGTMPGQQRPPGAPNMGQQHSQVPVNGQQPQNMNGQMPQHARPPLPMTTRNGHLAVPQVNAQGIPQAQMQPGRQLTQLEIQRLAQQQSAQQRGMPYPSQQQYQMMPNGHAPSPGQGGMSTAQQLQSNQQLLAQMQQQQQQQHQGQQQTPNNVNHSQATPHPQATSHPQAHQVSASPNMPPPPTPHAQQSQQPPQQLSSGHVPALLMIKQQLRQKHPHLSEDQLNQAATSTLREQSQNQAQSTNQARQNAMNAAAGISTQTHHSHPANMQAYTHNQAAFQNNQQMPNGNAGPYMNSSDGSNSQSPNLQRPTPGSVHQSPQAMAAYANRMRQQSMMQMGGMQQSPNGTHAQLNGGSPAMAQASPAMAPASPSMPYSQVQNGQQMGPSPMAGATRPPSRSQTPQMQRLSSSGSVPGVNGMASGMPSPSGLAQGSPRNMQASMAR